MARFILPMILSALSLGTGTHANEASFEERVRAYLLENPEVILEALEVLSAREAQTQLEARIAAFPEFFTDPPQLGMGDPNASLRIIEFFDYKCAPCRAIHPVLAEFAAGHPNVRIEMRHLPILSPGSERAARFALAVQQVYGDGAYAEVDKRIWQLRGPMRIEDFEVIAADMGMDFPILQVAMESDPVAARIDYNREAAIALEVFGTPAFLTPTSLTVGSTDIGLLSETWLGP